MRRLLRRLYCVWIMGHNWFLVRDTGVVCDRCGSVCRPEDLDVRHT